MNKEMWSDELALLAFNIGKHHQGNGQYNYESLITDFHKLLESHPDIAGEDIDAIIKSFKRKNKVTGDDIVHLVVTRIGTHKKTRKTCITIAVEAAHKILTTELQVSPELHDLVAYFREERDTTGFVIGVKNGVLTWVDKKSNTHEIPLTALGATLGKIRKQS